MKCICGRSKIPDIRPELTHIILCPICKSRYHYIRKFKDGKMIEEKPVLFEKGNIKENVEKFDKKIKEVLENDI